MPLNIPVMEDEDIELQAEGETVTLKGKSTSMEPGINFYFLFKQLWAQAIDCKVITINITMLKFINSSGIGALIKIFREKPKGLKIVFKTDPEYNWQRISIRIIRTLNTEDISVI